MVMAFLVVMRAGEYQSLGPLDVEAADRLALALWVAAPIVGGIVAHRAADDQLARAGLALGLIVAIWIKLLPLYNVARGLSAMLTCSRSRASATCSGCSRCRSMASFLNELNGQ